MTRTLIAFDQKRFEIALVENGIRTEMDLAEKLGMSRSHSWYIRGGYIPDEDVQKKIAKKLGVKTTEFWKKVEVKR